MAAHRAGRRHAGAATPPARYHPATRPARLWPLLPIRISSRNRLRSPGLHNDDIPSPFAPLSLHTHTSDIESNAFLMRTAAIILLCCLLGGRCDASHRHLLQQRSTLSGEPGVLARAVQRDRAVLRAGQARRAPLATPTQCPLARRRQGHSYRVR